MTSLRLGVAGMWRRRWSWCLLAVGVAIAAALPVLAYGLRAEAESAAVRAAVAAVPAPQRAVVAVASTDLRGPELAAADAAVAAGFAEVGLGSPRRMLAFRPVAAGGAEFGLAAVGDATAALRLSSGRWPERCTPTACEVVAVVKGAAGPAEESLVRGARQLGVVVTGTGTLTDPRLVGSGLVAADRPLLLGADPAALAELESLALFGRNVAWLADLDPAAVTGRGVGPFAGRLAGLGEQLGLTVGPVRIAWPEAEIAAAADRAVAAGDRFAAWGAGAAGLQLGFALVTAAGLRRRAQTQGRLLSRRGASPAQLTATVAAPAALTAVAGLVVGALVAAAVVAVRARTAGLPGMPTAAEAVLAAVPVLAAVGLAAVLLVTLVGRWPAAATRATRLVVDVLFVAGILLVGYLLQVRSPQLAPALVGCLVVLTGVAAARLWGPAAAGVARVLQGRRTAGRGVRGPDPATRLALLGGQRRPLLPMVTAGFLAAACAAVVLAGGYRDSLARSAIDQAAAQVPMEVRVAPSGQVAAPLAAVPTDRLEQLGARVHPVLLSPVTAFAGSPTPVGLPLVGLDPDALPAMREFAATTGADVPAGELAGRLRAPVGEQAGSELPAGARRLGLRVEGLPEQVVLAVWLAGADGRQRAVELAGAGLLSAELPPGSRWRVTAVEMLEAADFELKRQHGIGEGDTDRELAGGTIRLGALTADGVPVGDWAGWGSDRAEVSGADGALVARFQIGDTRVVLTPGFAPRSALPPLPVATDPGTAARAAAQGGLTVTVNGLAVPARVVAVLPRMPTVTRPARPTPFVLADRAAATALLNRTAPGTATVDQVWIEATADQLPTVRTVLADSPAAAATVTYRSDVATRLAADPVAARSLTLLGVAGAAAVLLAGAAVATAVRAERDESAADLYALELDGLPPTRLRRALALRGSLAVALGGAVGIAGGAVAAGVGIPLLVTGPGGTAVDPPLRTVLATPLTGLTILAALAGGLLAAALAARAGLAGPRLAPPAEDLR